MNQTTINHGAHLEALTWLRGLAAFFVIISHTLRATEVSYTGQDSVLAFNVLSILDLGTFGVLLFFTLSGTTLYISNVKDHKKLGLSGFYLKRFFRIWPAYVVSLVVYVAFAPLFMHWYVEPQGLWIEKQFFAPLSMETLLSYVSLTFNITGPNSLINNAYWSLPVEFQYYLIFPLLALSSRYIGAFGPVMAAAILYAIFRWDVHPFHDSKVFMLGFTFCFGVAIGYLQQHNWLRHKLPAWLGAWLLVFGVVLSAAISNAWISLPDLPVISNVWICLGVLAAASVLIVLSANIQLPAALKRGLMRYGEISYSVYLYHNLLIAVAVCALIQFDIQHAWLRFAVVLLASTVLTYFVALLSFNQVEKVFINYGRRVAAKFK
ncbi:MAG: acyltransferase [Paraglaciecola sp.]|nr:acyltransferase [Paraglaciecola sp.]NCT47323.1 acyltransferase [Paraglaciecola sp.]